MTFSSPFLASQHPPHTIHMCLRAPFCFFLIVCARFYAPSPVALLGQLQPNGNPVHSSLRQSSQEHQEQTQSEHDTVPARSGGTAGSVRKAGVCSAHPPHRPASPSLHPLAIKPSPVVSTSVLEQHPPPLPLIHQTRWPAKTRLSTCCRGRSASTVPC